MILWQNRSKIQGMATFGIVTMCRCYFSSQDIIPNMETTSRTLLDKDLDKLKFVKESIERNEACLYDKQMCLDYLESVINPRCSICRKPIEGDMIVVKEHKMHPGCRGKYGG